jgi:hypothetical protein
VSPFIWKRASQADQTVSPDSTADNCHPLIGEVPSLTIVNSPWKPPHHRFCRV